MSLQQEIIAALGVKPTIDPAEEVRRSIDFLKSYLKHYSGLRTLVLGLAAAKTLP